MDHPDEMHQDMRKRAVHAAEEMTPGGEMTPDGEEIKTDAFDRWIAALRVDNAIDDLRRTRSLTSQASEEGSLAGVLADLAQHGAPVVIQLTSGRMHRGEIQFIGSDFFALRTITHSHALITYGAILSIRGMPRADNVTGDHPVASSTTLRHTLAKFVNAEARIHLFARDANEVITGELHAVGLDVATIRLDGTGGYAYVPFAAVAEVSLVGSG